MSEKLDKTIETLMGSIEQHISAKTIMGEPIKCGDITVFPMADVSFGLAAGDFNKDRSDKGTGGVGGKVSPAALLIIQNGTSKIVNVKDKDSVNKLIDMIPDVISMIKGKTEPSKEEEQFEE